MIKIDIERETTIGDTVGDFIMGTTNSSRTVSIWGLKLYKRTYKELTMPDKDNVSTKKKLGFGGK